MNERQELDRLLSDYRRQVLRWNKQINLVSRRDTEGVLGELLHQCRGGWDRLLADNPGALSKASALWYCDLGSGAGLPGYVWHAQAVSAKIPIRTWLVEPREKRAWFLNRLNTLGCVEPIEVLDNHWGGVPGEDFGVAAGDRAPSHVLISLKALHLTDSEVLAGLVPLLDALPAPEWRPRVLIARFYPFDQSWSADLAQDLEIPASGEVCLQDGRSFRGQGGRVLPALSRRGAGLVLSEYLAE